MSSWITGHSAAGACTAVATVAFDLIVAVEIGVAVAAVLALRNVARTTALTETPVPREIDDTEEHRLLRHHIVADRIDGALFFGSAQRFLTDLALVADVRVVILRLPDLQVLDATGAQALGEIIADLEHRHITVLLKGPGPNTNGSCATAPHPSHPPTPIAPPSSSPAAPSSRSTSTSPASTTSTTKLESGPGSSKREPSAMGSLHDRMQHE